MSADGNMVRAEAIIAEVSGLRMEFAEFRAEMRVRMENHTAHTPPCITLSNELKRLEERHEEYRKSSDKITSDLEKFKEEQGARWNEFEAMKQRIMAEIIRRLIPVALGSAGIGGGAALLVRWASG